MGTISSALSGGSSLNNTASSSNSGSGANNSGGSSNSSSGGANIFTGNSAYSEDLQNVVSRAVAIASLPINLLTGQQDVLSTQTSELATLDTGFQALQAALRSIGSAVGGAGMQSTVSDPSVASVTVGDGAAEGAYSISVSSIGTYATSLSSQTWNGGGKPTTYNLVLGTHTYTLTPSDNSAATVSAAINAQFGGVVQATAVNVGSAANPDYRISLRSATLGPMDLNIQAATDTSLQTAAAATSGYAVSRTANPWDTSGDPAAYSLVVDGTPYSLSPTDTSAASVAAAINALSGGPVTATVVDVGAGGVPDERIQLQSNAPYISTVDLQGAGGNSLQQQGTPPTAGETVSQTNWTWDSTPDPEGNLTHYTLALGGTAQTFSVNDNSAEGVAAAINALSGNPVTASVIDVGTGSNPDYRIQLTDHTDSGTSPQLSRNTPFGLQTQGQPPGSQAAYEVANSGKMVYSKSRSVTIAAGTTVALTGTGTTDVTVTRSTATLSTALSGFADAYNALVTELAKQVGQSAGPLQGNPIVHSLSQALSAMSTYSSPTGSVGMANLGFTLNLDGTLSYSPLTMMGTDLGNSLGVTSFLGSAIGGGFLRAATDAWNGIENANTGLLKTTEASVQSQITRLGDNIAQKQAAVDQLQTQLTAEMAQADAAIATMEQQYSYLSSMFAAQQTANQMYANGA